jgi:hypothetical protein
MTVLIATSISIKKLTKASADRLDSIIAKGYAVFVGDAGGVDTPLQRHLYNRRYDPVTGYCINQPRNNLGTGRYGIYDLGKRSLVYAHTTNDFLWSVRDSQLDLFGSDVAPGRGRE